MIVFKVKLVNLIEFVSPRVNSNIRVDRLVQKSMNLIPVNSTFMNKMENNSLII